MILGLDLATHTGWAVASNDGKIISSGMQDFSKKRGEDNGLLFLRYRKWLKDLLQQHVFIPEQQTLVAYEAAHFRGGAATELCVGMQTHTQSMVAEMKAAGMDILIAPVRTGVLKKFATGSGAAGKEEMIAEARKWLDHEPATDDEADAVMIARWASNEFYVLIEPTGRTRKP